MSPFDPELLVRVVFDSWKHFVKFCFVLFCFFSIIVVTAVVSFATLVRITPCPFLPRPSLSACVTRATQLYCKGTRGDSSQPYTRSGDVSMYVRVAMWRRLVKLSWRRI